MAVPLQMCINPSGKVLGDWEKRVTPDEITHWIGKMEEYNMYLHHFPLPKEYRDTTSFRQFRRVCQAKREELGLTDEIYAQLQEVKNNEALDWAFVEIGMTEDNRELLCPIYFQDLPLNYYWMPEYDEVREAVEAQWMADDETLQELVWKLAPPIPNTRHDDGVSGVLFS